jgi:hypothetical protein
MGLYLSCFAFAMYQVMKVYSIRHLGYERKITCTLFAKDSLSFSEYGSPSVFGGV